ncbi:MAG: hypothetical protein E7324_01915 [Clostridiales bacterium]|nr:hypothetical protein [Clostridiales bacterium]
MNQEKKRISLSLAYSLAPNEEKNQLFHAREKDVALLFLPRMQPVCRFGRVRHAALFLSTDSRYLA